MPTYRYEISPNKRAGCQSTQCKDDAVKIMKGELRFATLVTINGHDGWKYKHWGCVTPRQIYNITEEIGGLEGLDLDHDLDILDGYEELEPWAQEKVKFALRNGHVEDEDWKGDPELNRPGMKGTTKKRTPKKKKGDDAEEGEDVNSNIIQEASPSKPQAKKARSKGKSKQESDQENDHSSESTKKSTGRKRKAASAVDEDEEETKPKKKRVTKKSQMIKDEIDGDEEESAKPARKRGKRVKQEDADSDIHAPVDGAEEAVEVPEPKLKKSVGGKTKPEQVTTNKNSRSRKVKGEEQDDADEDVKMEADSADELASASPTPIKKPAASQKGKAKAVKAEEYTPSRSDQKPAKKSRKEAVTNDDAENPKAKARKPRKA